MNTGDTMPVEPGSVSIPPQSKDRVIVSGQSAEINPPPTAKGGKGGPAYIAEQLWPLAVPIDTLTPDPANARKHGEKNMAAIRASLSRFGQRAPIVVQRQGMVIRAGNGRWLAAKAMGWTQIAAVVVDDSSIDAVAFAIADNRTAELAEWDNEVLANLLNTMPEEDMAATGFDEADLNELLSELTPDVVEDDVPEAKPNPVSKTGDLWELGEHRLLCGDSTSADDVKRLMGGVKADLCFTSPPYNAGSNKLGGNASMVESKYIGDSDNKSDDEYHALITGFTDCAMGVCCAAVVNIQQLAGNKRTVLRWMAEQSERFVDMAIWAKASGPPQMAPNVLTNEHELLVILSANPNPTRAIPFANWHGDVGTLYRGGGQKDRDAAAVHAATMPIHLPLWVIQVLCPNAQSIYEPFCGSGTTLIAAEQLGRKCYGMEISPQYCDVIVTRWEKLTGKKAACNGKTIEQLAEERGVVV